MKSKTSKNSVILKDLFTISETFVWQVKKESSSISFVDGTISSDKVNLKLNLKEFFVLPV